MQVVRIFVVLLVSIPVTTDNIIIGDSSANGCYQVTPDGKGLSIGGGDYHFNLVSVKQCIALCKQLEQSYAACQAGRLCRCGTTDLIEQMQNASEAECDIRCSGEVLDMCGGRGGFVNVYSTEGAVKSLSIDDPGVIELYLPVVINTTLLGGHESVSYSYDWGDGVQSPAYAAHQQAHVYTDEGIYLVRANASNNVSGPIEAQLNIYAESPVNDIRTSCDPFVEVGSPFECQSSFGQGTNVSVEWDFGDGEDHVNIRMSDAERFSAGPTIPHHLDQVSPTIGIYGAYVAPSLSFSEPGKIEAWEVYASKEGQVTLQVYRPVCGLHQRYCAFNESCVSRFTSCLPPTERACSADDEAFCLLSQSCHPFRTEYFAVEENVTVTGICDDDDLNVISYPNSSILFNETLSANATLILNATNQDDCNRTYWEVIDQWQPLYYTGGCDSGELMTDPWPRGYRLVKERLVYLQEGYNIFRVPPVERVLVEVGDIIGFSTYRQQFPYYYPKAAYPMVGEVALSPDASSEVYVVTHPLYQPFEVVDLEGNASLVFSGGLFLKARASMPSASSLTYSYQTSGMFSIETSYINALPDVFPGPTVTIAAQYRVLGVGGTRFTRDLGRYYACTDEVFQMHVEVDQGTFVRLDWTFPDGKHNLTTPFLHNDIVDGPGVKTPDSQGFQFYEIGNYTTSVVAYNNVSSASVDLETIARYRIKGLHGFIINYADDNTTQAWNLTLAGTWFNVSSVITSGNKVEYLWVYGDGSDSISWEPGTIYSHFFTEPGMYTVLVQADNIASTMDYSFQVEAVKANRVLAPSYTTSELVFDMVCEVTWHTGEGLTFEWDFGDGNVTVVEGINHVHHDFGTYSEYSITCTILDFPHVTDTLTVTDQDPVEGVKLMNITEVKATGDEVEFVVTRTRGNDVQFHWYFGDGEVDTVTFEPEVIHIYSRTGFYSVTVNISNIVSWMMSPPIIVELQERITNLRIDSANNIIFADVAARVSYDTGNKVFSNIFFGDGFNVSASLSSEERHRYSYPALYTINVFAFNAVSSQRADTGVLIDSRITEGRLLVDTPWIRADEVTATCWAMNGSSVGMTFDWGDGQVTGSFAAEFVETGSFFKGLHTYSSEGTFNITCYMENDWSDATARSKVLLQEAITVLEFTPTVTVKGDIFQFTVLPFLGDTHDVLFRWSYNDGSYYTTQEFSHQYVYTTAGIYYVELTANNLVSELAVSQQVYVQEHVEGLYLSHIYPVEPGWPTLVIWQIEHGTDVEYEVDMGDGTTPSLFLQSEIGKGNTLEYVYSLPGSYDLTLTAFNKLNSLDKTAVVHVEYPIQGLRAFIHGNSTVHTDKSAIVFINIDQGTNVVYTCDYGDGSARLVTTRPVCRHMFIDLGFHRVSVFAENHLSQAYTVANESYEVILPPIPQRIENLEIVAEDSTILGRVTYFQMRRTRGNRYNCTWDFGDGHQELMDQSMVFDLFSHTYERAGRYLVVLNCSNFFSRPVLAYSDMTVQEPVWGLNFSSLLMGQYGMNLTVTILLEGGTDPLAEILFNDMVFPVMMTGLTGLVVIPAALVNVTGWQNISVVAWNMVPPELAVTSMIYLEAQISNLVMWTDTPYVTIGSVVTFHVSFDLGTDISLEWYFGDNTVLETFVKESRGDVFTMNHLYTEEGLYAAMVMAENRINVAFNTPLLIAVEDPVQGFHVTANTPVRFPDGVVNFTITWNMNSRALPDNTSVIIDLGIGELPTEVPLEDIPAIQYYKMNNVCAEYVADLEGNPVESILADSCDHIIDEFSGYVDGSSLLVMEISHQFDPGQYDAIITVSNMASKQEFTFSVETQVPVAGCVTSSCLWLDDDCVPGGGPDESYFSLELPVTFEVICDNGTGMRYSWRFGDGHQMTTTDLQVAHEYEIPGSYDLRIISGNIFGWEVMYSSVDIQESVIGLYISQGPVTSQTIIVIIFALQPGSESTFNLTVPSLGIQEPIDPPSFNSTLKARAISHWNQDAYVPFNISAVAMTYHEVSFPTAGLWEVIVTGTNYASEETVQGFVSVSEESCDLPEISIMGVSGDFRAPTSIRGTQGILMMAEIEVSCPQTRRLGLRWRVYPLLTYEDALLPPENATAFNLPPFIVTSALTFNLVPGALYYGRYTMELLATLDNDGEVSNRRLAFLEVVPSPLVSTIDGGGEEMVEEGAFFTINGTGSGDPDEEFYHARDGAAEAVWYCHLGNETINLDTGEINGEGCFGDSVGRITNDTLTLSYWTSNLTQHDEFVFTLLVKSNGRDTAEASKTIRVNRGVTYPISVRCLKNCLNKLNPTMELVLAAGCDCEANETDVSYTWEIAGLGNEEDLIHYTDTGFQSPYLQLAPSLLADSSGGSFDVSLTARIGLVCVGRVTYTYQIAEELVKGSCTVSPTTGVALTTEFDIICEGFSTSHPPLMYRFLVSREGPDVGTFSLLSMSPGRQASNLMLPAGQSSLDHRVYLGVQVTDAFGVTAMVDLTVQVLPAEHTDVLDQLSYIQSGDASLLDVATGKGDQQKATSLIADLSEAMNEDQMTVADDRNFTKDAKETVRGQMVSTLEEIKILTIDLGRQTTGALTAVVAEPDEIDAETQSRAIDIYSDILERAREESSSNPEAVQEIYLNFLEGAPSLLQASALHALAAAELIKPEPTTPPTETSESSSEMDFYPRVLEVIGVSNETSLEEEMYLQQMREVKDSTERVLEMLEMVGTLIVQSEVPSESAIMVHQSETLMMSVQKVSTIGTETRLYTMPDGSWLRLPAEVIERVKSEAEDNEIITQMYSFPINPFTWHGTDVNILTTVIGFTMKNTDGDELHVSGLTDEVEVFLPRGESSALSFDTMTAHSHELLTVSFNVTEPSSSIHIDIHPTRLEEGSRIEAYLRFGFLPTMNTYDLKTTLPSEVTVMSFNQSANFTTNPYTWFIEEDSLYATGSYYLAIRAVGADGGNATGVVTQVDVDVKIYTARCLFWSPVDQQWLPDGCEVGGMTTSSFTHCLCDHLTFIGGTFSVPPSELIVFEEEVEVVPVPIMTDLVTYISVLLALAAIICLIAAAVVDIIRKRQMFKGLDMLEDIYVVKIFTGLGCDSTTTAQVFIVLHGPDSQTNPTLLNNEHLRAFCAGSVDTFLVPTARNLGNIVRLTVWQDGHGYSPAWHLSRITVEHYQSGKQSTFLCNTKLIKPNRARTFLAASPYQTANHRHLFQTEPLIGYLSLRIPLLSLLIRSSLDPHSHTESVCVFFGALSSAALLTTILGTIMGNPAAMTNTFSVDMNSVIGGGAIGGAVLLVYYLLEALCRSVQPKLPVAPRSAGYHETANNDQSDVKLKAVKEVASLGDINIKTKEESTESVNEWGSAEEWDGETQSQGNLNNSASGLIGRSVDTKGGSDWLKKPKQRLRRYVASFQRDQPTKLEKLRESSPKESSCFQFRRKSSKVEVSDWTIPLCDISTSNPHVDDSMNIDELGAAQLPSDWAMPAADRREQGKGMNIQNPGFRSSTPNWRIAPNSGDSMKGDAGMNMHDPRVNSSASDWWIASSGSCHGKSPPDYHMNMHDPQLMSLNPTSDGTTNTQRQNATGSVMHTEATNMHGPVDELKRDWWRCSGSAVSANGHDSEVIEMYDWRTASACARPRLPVAVEDIIVDVHDSDEGTPQGSESELPECDRSLGWESWTHLPGTIEHADENHRIKETCFGDHLRTRQSTEAEFDRRRGNARFRKNVESRERRSMSGSDHIRENCLRDNPQTSQISQELDQPRGNPLLGRYVNSGDSGSISEPGNVMVHPTVPRIPIREQCNWPRDIQGIPTNIGGRERRSEPESGLNQRSDQVPILSERNSMDTSKVAIDMSTGQSGEMDASSNISANNANTAAGIRRRNKDLSSNASRNNSNEARAVHFQSVEPIPEERLSLLGRLVEFCFGVSHRRGMPWWVSLLILPMTFALVPVSAFAAFTLTVGVCTLDMAYQWIVTFGTATFIFVSVPVILACLSTFVVNPLRHSASLFVGSQEFEDAFKSFPLRGKAPEAKTFDKAKLLSSVNVRVTEMWMIWQIMFHVLWLLFLAMLGYMALQQRSTSDFYVIKNIKDVFARGDNLEKVGFYQATDFDSFWDWSEGVLIPALVSAGTDRAESHHLILSTPRLRQFRVDPTMADACRKLSPMDFQSSNCSSATQDSGQYINSWTSLIMSDTLPRQDQGYHYYTPGEMPGTTTTGSLGSYHSGGYVVEIPGEPGTADYILQRLKERRWFDGDTVALMVEFSLYNVNVDVTSVVQFMLEASPTGYLIPSVDIRCINTLSGTDGPQATISLCLEMILLLAAVMRLICELYTVHREGARYYQDLGCLVNLLTMAATLVAAATAMLRRISLNGVSLATPDFGALSSLASINEWYTAALAMSIFMVISRQIKALGLTSYFLHFGSVLGRTSMSLVFALPFFAVFVFGSTWTGWMLFSGMLQDLHTHLSGFTTLLNARLGNLGSSSGNTDFPFPLFVIVYTSLCALFGMIAFSVVAMQSYSDFKVRHAFEYFLDCGRLSNIVRNIKSGIIIQKTLHKVRRRKRVIAREYRRWRNGQPMTKQYAKRIVRAGKRADRLLGACREENKFMLDEPELLVDVTLREYDDRKK